MVKAKKTTTPGRAKKDFLRYECRRHGDVWLRWWKKHPRYQAYGHPPKVVCEEFLALKDPEMLEWVRDPRQADDFVKWYASRPNRPHGPQAQPSRQVPQRESVAPVVKAKPVKPAPAAKPEPIVIRIEIVVRVEEPKKAEPRYTPRKVYVDSYGD